MTNTTRIFFGLYMLAIGMMLSSRPLLVLFTFTIGTAIGLAFAQARRNRNTRNHT